MLRRRRVMTTSPAYHSQKLHNARRCAWLQHATFSAAKTALLASSASSADERALSALYRSVPLNARPIAQCYLGRYFCRLVCIREHRSRASVRTLPVCHPLDSDALLTTGYMSALTSPIVIHSWFGRAWQVASDFLIATALIWTLPLLLGAMAALLRLLLRAL